MERNKIGVYIKINENNEITAIGSSIFVKNLTDWIKIDEGHGDKYAHAQGHYFTEPLIDPISGKFNYKFINGKIVNKGEN